MMGDFNRTAAEVEALVGGCTTGFSVVRPSESNRGTRKRSARAIDHIGVAGVGWAAVCEARILRDIDMSDHYPVVCRIRNEGDTNPPFQRGRCETAEQTPNRQSRIDPGKVPVPGSTRYKKPGPSGEESHHKWMNSNYWEPLIELTDTVIGDLPSEQDRQALGDAAAERLTQISHKACCGYGYDPCAMGESRPPALKKKITRAISRRGELHAQAMGMEPGTQECKDAWVEHKAAAKVVKEMVHEDRRKKWRKALHKACDQMKHDPHNFWQWTSKVAGWKLKSSVSGTQPVRHPSSGILLTEENDIRSRLEDTLWPVSRRCDREQQIAHEMEQVE